MNTCDTCKWWGESKHLNVASGKFCSHPKVDGEDTYGLDIPEDSGPS